MTADRLEPHPDDEDVATAVGRYALGELSLGKAAERAGMTRWEFEELLEDAGFQAMYGPRTREAAEDEVDTALDHE
jgi:predicted HTH domain antitoxin